MLVVASGCSLIYEEGPEAPAEPSVRPDFITLSVTAPAPSRTAADGRFETGSSLENHIDFDGKDYRLLIFSADDTDDAVTGGTFLTQLPGIASPVERETTIEGVRTVTYTVTAQTTEAFPENSFRLVMLANWGEYPVLAPGKTTLAQLTEHDAAQFTAPATPADNGAWLSAGKDDKRLIPFYGVRKYTYDASDVKISSEGYNRIHTLDFSKQALPLLRAMCKMELIVDDPDLSSVSLSAATITLHNSKGFCAPSGAFDHIHYFNGYDYTLDFTSTPHIPADATASKLGFTRAEARSADGSTKERWVAYMPEYLNIGDGAEAASIEVTVNGINGKATVMFNLPDNTSSPTIPYNLLRNNLYRITITDISSGSASGKIVAVPWTYKSLPEIEL